MLQRPVTMPMIPKEKLRNLHCPGYGSVLPSCPCRSPGACKSEQLGRLQARRQPSTENPFSGTMTRHECDQRPRLLEARGRDPCQASAGGASARWTETHRRAGCRARASLSQEVRVGQGHPGRHPHPGRPAPTALHHRRGSARVLSHRHAGRAAGRNPAPAHLQRHHGQTQGPLLLPPGCGQRRRAHRAQLRGHGHDQTGHLPEHDDLWPLHRRAGGPLRRREDRLFGDSRGPRQLGAPAPLDAGFSHHQHPPHASFALYFADILEKRGINPRKDLSLKRAFVGAEPYTEETRRKIEDGLGLRVFIPTAFRK